MSAEELEPVGNSPKKPLPYDYYNPATWLVDSPESEEVVNQQEAKITDDIFAKLTEQMEKVDKEDLQKQNEAKEEAEENERENGDSPNRGVMRKPGSQPGSPSPLRLPYRKATMKIFPDEESDSEGGDDERDSESSDDDKDSEVDRSVNLPPIERKRGGRRKGLVEDLSEQEMREKARLDAAKRAMIKHRAQFVALDEHGDGEDATSHEALLESLLNPANIPPPDPPQQVFALGKDGCAAVWWHYDRGNVPEAAWITEWEVKRYRMDRDGEWRFKGATIINEPHLIDKNRCTVELLENDCQYSFSVTATNRRGRGFESPKSEAVMVEAVLPPGWFRFWHDETQRFFYSNIKTRQAVWARPEKDDWYLDEGVILAFNVDERAYLRELYEEEMHHFRRITVQGFKRIMLDVGEIMGKTRIRDYLIEYCGKEQITSWTDFMYIVGSIKRKKQHRDRGSNCNMMMNYTIMLPCYIWTECLSVEWTRCSLMYLLGGDAHHERQKIGDWVVEWSPLAERYCYTNSKTHNVTWDTPEEVRFYVPPKMMETLLQYFSEGDLADFKVRFGHLDLNNSGFIDEHEFKLLLESMDINVSDRNRSRLIREIDINGNGTIEFHEFCFMMLNLHQPTKKQGMSSIWEQIKSLSDNEQQLQKVTDDMVAVDMWEEEHGEHDQAHNPHFHVRRQRKSLINSRDGVHSSSSASRRPGTGLKYESVDQNALIGGDDGDVHGGVAVMERELIERTGTAASARPGTHAGNRAGTNIELVGLDASRPSTHERGISRGATPFTRSALATPAMRPPSPNEITERGDGVWDFDMAKGKSVNFGKKDKKDHSSIDNRLGGSGSWDDSDAHSQASSERASSANSELIIDQLMKRHREEEEERRNRQWIKIDFTADDVLEFLLHFHEHSAVCFFYSVDLIDKGIDTIMCKGEEGPHGRHCMCGCRRLVPEDVLYPPFTKSKDEPLTWNYVCPCCCSEN